MTQAAKTLLAPGVEVRGPLSPAARQVLAPEAVAFVAELQRRFGARREQLLARRQEVAARLAAGGSLDFLEETKAVREEEWRVAPLPEDLLDRRVEITGPAEPKMVINALNSGANVFMADFEDSLTPTFDNLMVGQLALQGAVRRTLTWEAPETGKRYQLKERLAVLFVRPRGWHLPEEHLWVDGAPVSGSLFDFGLFFFHNAREQLARGTGPYFYLPKLESHLEARLWNDVFHHAQAALGIARGTIKATVLIETLPAAFEMDEILYELREHSAGLNCGRWDYIFSFIKKNAHRADAVLPDRGQVTMDKGFLRAYSQLLIRTCHRRGVHAMGGMSAFIPVKGNDEANEAALQKVREDKLREVKDGHDGTWVAHPALVAVAKELFDAHMPGSNQLSNLREDVQVGREELLRIPRGSRTEEGLRQNVRVGVQYIEAWLQGLGCVPLYQLMEDAATAEISRAQVWQQLHYGAELEGLGRLTRDTFARVVDEELERVRSELGEERFSRGRFREAKELFVRLSTAPTFEEFLTLPAYRQVVSSGA
jgi:malate synthase